MTELDADIRFLKKGLADIEKEIDYQKKSNIVTGQSKDKFVSEMSNFVSHRSYDFSEVEEQLAEMKERVSKSVTVMLY